MKNVQSEIKYKLNFNFTVPKEYCDTFQSIFTYIKKKFQIKFSRKSQIDSLLKKTKGKFFKAINDVMNICLNITVKRLPQSFITNITIEYNQIYLNRSVIELYQEFNLLPSFYSLLEQNLIKSDKKEIFREFCCYNLLELYNIYIESKRFAKDKKQIKFQDGKRVGLLFEFVSSNFTAYYQYGKPHLPRNKEISTGELSKKKSEKKSDKFEETEINSDNYKNSNSIVTVNIKDENI